jgi:hypothetical protein
MATAIELRSMNDDLNRRRSMKATSTTTALSPETTESSIARRRSTSAIDHKQHPDDETPSYYEATPQDSVITVLPQESPNFAPTHTFWLTPHSPFTRSILVYDLTTDISTPYTGLSPAYKAAIQKALKDHSPTPYCTITRQNWLGSRYTITDSQSTHICDWKHPWSSVGEAVLTFPADSTHSSHAISLKNKRWGLRTEVFVVDSVPYEWASDSLFVSQNMTLYTVLRDQRVEVGKFANRWWGSWSTGGVLVVDARKVDDLVAVMSLAVVLKKKRQRAAERSSGGGGGGGGR